MSDQTFDQDKKELDTLINKSEILKITFRSSGYTGVKAMSENTREYKKIYDLISKYNLFIQPVFDLKE